MTPKQVRNLGAAIENTGRAIPDLDRDWAKQGRDVQIYCAVALQELAGTMECLAKHWLANLNPEENK